MNETPNKTSAPRRIVHTENSLGWGGQEIRVFTELRAMQARGHTVWIAAPSRSSIFSRAQEAHISVLALDDRRVFYPLTILRLRSFFRRVRANVVNTHSSRDGWLGGIAARLARVPLVIRSRHIEVDYPNRFTSRIAYHHLPHHVLTTSRKISERLVQELGLEPNRVTTLPTGIDLERFDPAVPGSLHGELNLSPQTALVGMISVLRSWKGHAYFLEAASRILRGWKNVHFIIAGDGPGAASLPGKIRAAGVTDHVTCLGHREDVPNVLASLSVLVLPSTAHEGIPQIILQAQAMGRAVVATSVGGIPEVVLDGETGLLVPPRDSQLLAEKIALLLDDAGLRVKLGSQARARVERENSVSAMCKHLETLYDQYLGS